jgi:hypothetical protein
MEQEDMDLVNLIQDRVKWRVVVDKLMNNCFPQNTENSLT